MGFAALDYPLPRKKENCSERTYKRFRSFRRVSAMESLKVLEDSQNKENMNDSYGFILLQNSWLSFSSLEINNKFLIHKTKS